MNLPFSVPALLIGVAGGLALFLFGMEELTSALRLAAGGRMKKVLARLSRGRFRAALGGAFVTSVIQSSSVTTVLVVGFVSAGLLTLPAAIAVILGANVGTTVTAQIIAFKVTQYGLVLVAAGFAVWFLARRDRYRRYGKMVFGLGLVFFGMEIMAQATDPLRTHAPFIQAMQHMDQPLLAVLVAAGFTAVVQSSSATTGAIIVLAAQGFITLEAGILLVMGANVGTCVTALLASVGKSRNAVRAAIIHVLFNVVGVLVWIGLVGWLADAVRWFSPAAAELSGTARLAAEVPRQIANAHTLFNVANTLLFIGFVGPLARLVVRILPERETDAGVARPKYLDPILVATPELALDRVRMELRRLGDRAHRMVERSLPVVLDGDSDDLAALAGLDEEIDQLHDNVIAYLGRLSHGKLSEEHIARLSLFTSAANHIEAIGDMVETSLVGAGRERLTDALPVSAETRALLAAYHGRVSDLVRLSFEALDAGSPAMADAVLATKDSLARDAAAIERHLASRLSAYSGDRIRIFKVEVEIVEYLQRVVYFSRRIARLVSEGGRPVDTARVPESGSEANPRELPPSREAI